jgi:hypothetical protein
MRFDACVASVSDSEGRCVPTYLPKIAERTGLARDGCAKRHVCVPCFDPFDGTSTSVCDLPDDPGPSEPPKIFAACCSDLGRCVPASSIDPKDRGRLPRDACEGEALVCAPALLVEDPNAVPSSCTVHATSAEGRCLPRCLLGDTARERALEQDPCPDSHVCAPCFDPIDGSSTGACELGGDRGPTRPPELFAQCCGKLGRCVPSSLVPEKDREQLDSDDCTDSGMLCAPESSLADPPVPPKPCRVSAFDGEGRCLPACLPKLKTQRDSLAEDGCRPSELCAPCYDPITGEDTGACHLEGDGGPSEPPARFPECCGSAGWCLPAALIPPEWRDRVSADACEASEARCVPAAFVREPDFVASRCQDDRFQAEGRCLPICLPEVASMSERLIQANCSAAEVCVPCFDPIDASDTGACRLGGDPGPTSPPRTLPECCEGAGRCAPSVLVPPELLERTDAADCTNANDVCVPHGAVESTSFEPRACRDPSLGAEGRCLPACLPEVAARASLLRRADCETGELCVLCFDPVDQSDTGACHISSDPGPSSEPTALPGCCGGAGRCAPSELVPEMLRDQTARLDCDDASDALCIPVGFLRDPKYVPVSCRDPLLAAEGRCFPACLPQVAAQASRLRRADCQANELCVLCYDPATGEATGACSIAPADPGPTSAPVVFDRCCGTGENARGLCVPTQLLPQGVSQPPRDTCRISQVCAPAALVSDPAGRLPNCSSISTTRGVCVENCFLSNLQSTLVARGTCAADSQCVPCEILGSATGVCAP